MKEHEAREIIRHLVDMMHKGYTKEDADAMNEVLEAHELPTIPTFETDDEDMFDDGDMEIDEDSFEPEVEDCPFCRRPGDICNCDEQYELRRDEGL